MTRTQYLADRKSKIKVEYAILRLDKTKKRKDILMLLASKYAVSTFTIQEDLSRKIKLKKQPKIKS